MACRTTIRPSSSRSSLLMAYIYFSLYREGIGGKILKENKPSSSFYQLFLSFFRWPAASDLLDSYCISPSDPPKPMGLLFHLCFVTSHRNDIYFLLLLLLGLGMMLLLLFGPSSCNPLLTSLDPPFCALSTSDSVRVFHIRRDNAHKSNQPTKKRTKPLAIERKKKGGGRNKSAQNKFKRKIKKRGKKHVISKSNQGNTFIVSGVYIYVYVFTTHGKGKIPSQGRVY